MTADRRIYLACTSCRQPTLHAEVQSVQRGQVFLRCAGCGTVQHLARADLLAGEE
jgi:uncharacterized Zn finger protein